MIALIPARAGSKRIPGKNTKLLAGHPLIAYTIAAAKQSGVFVDITVCTDDRAILDKQPTLTYGVMWREGVPDDQPDIVWVDQALGWHEMQDNRIDSFAILRPTSPFRTADTIRRAYQQFTTLDCDSLRAVQPVSEHPGKMWVYLKSWDYMEPVFPALNEFEQRPPFHSSPTQTLPPVYRQNASLEMAWTRVVADTGTITGDRVMPFFTEGYEGFDLNTPDDWTEAERLIECGAARLPDLR